jgi:hypothetical protein
VDWCVAHFPAGRAYVGAYLVEGASAVSGDPEPDPRHDRFTGGVMGLTLPHGTPQSAIDVAVSLSRLLGATAFFLDPGELDSACAATESLPLLFTAALMHMSAAQPGWRDARRFTGRTFARATGLLADLNARPAAHWLAISGPSLAPKLEALIAELGDWRAALAAGDEEAVTRRLSAASDAHTAWLGARRRGEWEVEETRVAPPVEGPNFLERLLVLGARRGRKDRG